jgi:excisionase family DNA binding protein
MTTQLLYSPEQAAELLSVSRTRVYDLMSAGKLKSVKLGRSRRISADALLDFVKGLAEEGST